MKKKKKLKFSTEKQKAWALFSKYIRLRDALATIGNRRQCKCITCDDVRNIYGVGCMQAGHFIPGRNNAVLFNEEQVSGQCYVCNKIKNGNWVKYERVMVKRYGRAKVEKMKIDAEKTVKMTTQDMIDIQAKYKKKIEDLGGFPKNI